MMCTAARDLERLRADNGALLTQTEDAEESIVRVRQELEEECASLATVF